MESPPKVKYYAAPDIEVSFDASRCIHSGKCLLGLPEVFDTARRPWILPTAAVPDAVASAIELCPSGALHYRRLDGAAEEVPTTPVSIQPRRNGPLYVRGLMKVHALDGTLLVEDTRMALCRCGQSGNAPFCDNSHRRVGFQERSTD